MIRPEETRFVRSSAVLAAAIAIVTIAVAGRFAAPSTAWALVGWLVVVPTFVVGGARLVRALGAGGHGFMLALVACMLSRLLTAAVGAAAAVRSGQGAAVPAYVAGMLAAFVALQAFEVIWFVRNTRDPLTCVTGRPPASNASGAR